MTSNEFGAKAEARGRRLVWHPMFGLGEVWEDRGDKILVRFNGETPRRLLRRGSVGLIQKRTKSAQLVENPAPSTKSDRTHLKRICEKAAEQLYPWRRGKVGPMDHLKVTERLFRELLIGFWAGHKPLQIQAWNKLMGIALKACRRLYDSTINTGFQQAEGMRVMM